MSGETCADVMSAIAEHRRLDAAYSEVCDDEQKEGGAMRALDRQEMRLLAMRPTSPAACGVLLLFGFRSRLHETVHCEEAFKRFAKYCDRVFAKAGQSNPADREAA